MTLRRTTITLPTGSQAGRRVITEICSLALTTNLSALVSCSSSSTLGSWARRLSTQTPITADSSPPPSFSPLTEFYGDDQAYTIGTVTQSGNTVTVTTAANEFVSNQIVVISGVEAGTGGCTSAAANAIGREQTVTVTSPTTFTFTSTVNATIGGANGSCNVTSALATGPTQDYLFFSSTRPEVFTFALPLSGATQTATATNTTSAGYIGTSGDHRRQRLQQRPGIKHLFCH